MKYYPITRYRNILTQDYIERQVRNGAPYFSSFKEADEMLDRMDTDDSDYEVCIFDGTKWCATRDGVTVCHRAIP